VRSLKEADEVVVNINSHNHHTGSPGVANAIRLPDRYGLVSCCGRVVNLMGLNDLCGVDVNRGSMSSSHAVSARGQAIGVAAASAAHMVLEVVGDTLAGNHPVVWLKLFQQGRPCGRGELLLGFYE
jgi:hypothetical protein